MKTLTITLEDNAIQQLGARAQEAGMGLEVFLAKAIEQNADKLIRPRKWMPHDTWASAMRGDHCPDCEHLKSGQNPHGYPVAQLEHGRLELMKSQFVPGACVLYCTRHVREPYELDMEERRGFFDDMVRAAKALTDVFHPDKMNYQILGNLGPHLHVYLQPRFYGDLEPGWPIDPYKEQVFLTEAQYQERVHAIRDALVRLSV